MTQVQLLSRACAVALVIVSVVFFIYVLIKAPLLGVIKINLIVFAWFKSAFFGLAGIIWMYLNFREKDD